MHRLSTLDLEVGIFKNEKRYITPEMLSDLAACIPEGSNFQVEAGDKIKYLGPSNSQDAMIQVEFIKERSNLQVGSQTTFMPRELFTSLPTQRRVTNFPKLANLSTFRGESTKIARIAKMLGMERATQLVGAEDLDIFRANDTETDQIRLLTAAAAKVGNLDLTTTQVKLLIASSRERLQQFQELAQLTETASAPSAAL